MPIISAQDALEQEQSLRRQLQRLDCSQAKIEEVSFYCLFHSQKAAKLALIVKESILKSSASSTATASVAAQKMLAHLYLISDVVQNAKKKGKGDFWLLAMKPIVEDLVRFVCKQCEEDLKVLQSVKRIMDVWEERKVFGNTLKPKKWVSSSISSSDGDGEIKTTTTKKRSANATTNKKRKEQPKGEEEKHDDDNNNNNNTRQQQQLLQIPLRQQLEGDDALFAEALREARTFENEFKRAERVYNEDVSSSLRECLENGTANEQITSLYKTPTEQLNALQSCESALAKKRAAIENLIKSEQKLFKRVDELKKALEQKKANENKVLEQWLSESPALAMKVSTARMKASKRNAQFIAESVVQVRTKKTVEEEEEEEEAEETNNKEFEIPEPVDMDNERNNGEDDDGDDDEDEEAEEYEP